MLSIMERVTLALEALDLKVTFRRQLAMDSLFLFLFLYWAGRHSGGVFHSLQCRNCGEDNRLVSNLVFPKAWQNRNKSVFKS